MTRKLLFVGFSLFLFACGEDSSSSPTTDSMNDVSGDGFEAKIDEENQRFQFVVPLIFSECSVSADSQTVTENPMFYESTWEYVYQISNDTLYLRKEIDGELSNLTLVYTGNSKNIYGTWIETDFQIYDGVMEKTFENYNPFSYDQFVISQNQVNLNYVRNKKWNLYKTDPVMKFLEKISEKKSGNKFDAEHIFRHAQDIQNEYPEGVTEISRDGDNAVFDIKGTQVTFSSVTVVDVTLTNTSLHFSIQAKANGKTCEYDYVNHSDMHGLCTVENIPYFQMEKQVDGSFIVHSYEKGNNEEFSNCLATLLQ